MLHYRYQDLPNDRTWIRVLRLAGGSAEAPLEASLEAVKIQDQPRYEALSYCWGSNETPCELSLREQSQNYLLPITRNLDRAMRRLRHVLQERVIWTDAVCIHQKNDREKSHQVRLMGDIYSAATRVLAYLGEPDELTRRAVQLLGRINQAAKDASTYDQRSALQWIKDSNLPLPTENWKWEPLKAFFRRSWFRRKWIIQECALASQVEFYCGTWTCDWNFMSLVVETIYDKGLAVMDYTTSINTEDGRQLQIGLSQINAIRLYKQGRQNNRSYRFLDLVYHFQTSEATDKRDHLFALLALAMDSQDAQLNPDYKCTNSVLQNCLRYARHFLHRDQTLEVLYRAGLADHDLLAPSWIPNWYGRQQALGFEPTQGFWDPRLRPEHLHVARGTSVSMINPGHPTDVLLGLKGIVIDTITELANEHLVDTRDAGQDKNLLLAHRREHLLESHRITSQLKTYPRGGSLEDILWRTLMCNTTLAGKAPDDSLRGAYEAWRRVTLIASAPNQLEADFRDSQPFSRVIGGWNADKIFGLTAVGYVGMFPRHAKKADVIAVLYGGEFPFILRPCTEPRLGNHELVGQCYVHGIMEEGQFDLEQWKTHERDIWLG